MATQTTNTLTIENKEFYDKTLLKRMVPTLVYSNYAQKKPLGKNNGKTISFRKFNSLQTAQTPLVEGVTPVGNNLSMTEIKATVNQYGDYVEISDVLDLVGIDPVLTETAELLGEQAGLTIDNLVKDVVCAGTNVRYVGSASRPATSTDTVCGVMNAKEIQKAVRTLKNDNAIPFDGKYYIGIIDPDISYDLQQDPLFLDVSKYNGGTQIIDGEIGKLGKVRFIETTNTKVKTQASGGFVHCAMIIGKDAYGIVDIDGSGKPEMIVKSHGSAGAADPLDQRATSGWKALFAAKRLNELAMIRIECLTSTELENNEYNGVSIDSIRYNASETAVFEECGEVTVNGRQIIIDGAISKASEAAIATLDDANYTHAIAIEFINPNANFDVVKYQVSGGNVVTTDANFEDEHLVYVVGMSEADLEYEKTLTIWWDGVNPTEYSFIINNVTLEQ